MLLATGLFEHNPNQEILITAGGGGTIKLWSLDTIGYGRPQLLEKFKNKGLSVLSLAYKAPFLYAGLSGGIAHIYNLASRQLVQKLNLGHGDILQVQISNGSAICGTSEGWVAV
jgi:WD40 repeat protein